LFFKTQNHTPYTKKYANLQAETHEKQIKNQGAIALAMPLLLIDIQKKL